MKNRILGFSIFIVVFLLVFVVSAKKASAESVTRATLRNGLRVVIVRDTLAPVVTTEVNYIVGSNEAPLGFPGMAHAQEHMMFRGSPGLSADQLATLMAAMGGRADADTQQMVTQYFFTVPSKYLDVVLHIESLRMRDVLDREDLWEKERGAIEQEVARDLSSPMYVFYTKLLKKMFADTPYEHDALGTHTSFEKTTGTMLKMFYNKWYVPNNAILVITGDVEPGYTLSLVRKLFGNIPSHPLPPRPSINLKPVKPAVLHMQTDLPYGLSVIAYRMPGYDNPDFAAGQVLADVLDSQRGDLYALTVKGKALFSGFSNDSFPEGGLGYAVAAFPKGGNGIQLATLLKKVIANYVKEGVPYDLIEASKRHEIAGAEFRRNSVEGLAAEWSKALAVEGRRSPDDDIKAIKKVTVKDVNRVARRYLNNSRCIVAVLIPQVSGKPISSKGFYGRESFAPKETKAVSLPKWAKGIFRLNGIPMTRVKPYITRLSNGIRLIVQAENINHTVSIYGRVKNNAYLEEPPGKEGVSDILNSLFSYGTKKLNRLAFQRALDNIAATESAGTDFSLQVLSDYFEEGVGLLAQNLLQPAFPNGAFKVVQEETEGELAGELQSPSYHSKRSLLVRLYPKNDPMLRQATPNTVKSITLDDVKAYYKKVFRPDLTTIVVIGNVAPERAKRVIHKYFARWKAVGPKPATDLSPVPLNKSSAVVVPDSSRIQDEVTLMQTLDLTRSNPDYYPMQLGLHVLSGGFYATRLYRDLREKRGLVYTVEAFLEAEKARSIFGIVYACDPANVVKAHVLIKRDLLEMQKEPVSLSELKRAKMLLIRKIPLDESSVSDIADGFLYRSLENLPLDEPIRAAKHYIEATPAEVQKVFSKYIRPDGFVQVTRGPNPGK